MSDGFDSGRFRPQQHTDVAAELNNSGEGLQESSDHGAYIAKHARSPQAGTADTPPIEIPQPNEQQRVHTEAMDPQGAPPSTSDDLSTAAVLHRAEPAPSSGWRRWLYWASFKLINVGESPRAAHHNSLAARINRPLGGCYRIALLSLKGGVGKTTITVTLGGTLASIRRDHVVALEANSDRGTLSQKVVLDTPATVRNLLRDAEGIKRYSDIRRYTSQGPSRLEVLASESDPAASEAFSAAEYTRTLDILQRFYSLVLTDCGTGLTYPTMSATLAKADMLIVIASGSVDGARGASATLDWLDAHGHQDMVANSVAVINAVRPPSRNVDMNKIVNHFSQRCRAVSLVPFDPHLETGAEIEFDLLNRATRKALIELAAVVADGFSSADRRDLFV